MGLKILHFLYSVCTEDDGDVQQYCIDNSVHNHCSVSISGYHIAEAGANPITQLALTLANGFTYINAIDRGMDVAQFTPELCSLFFSNGLNPEYTVIGGLLEEFGVAA